MKDKEIKRIFGEVADKEGRELITTTYKVGDSVRIIETKPISKLKKWVVMNETLEKN